MAAFIADRPVSELRTKVTGLRFLLGGVVLTGIGISQAATGWIGDGVYQRWVYPILCFIMAVVCAWIGYQAIAPPADDVTDDCAPS